MDIVIVAQYLRNIENFSGNNSRFVYLAKMLANDLNNKVEIITSDFNHGRKENISKIGELKGVTVTPIHESGYGKNVCLKRFISHMELAKNIKKYLSNRKKPDVCYCAVPSLDVAKVVADYCKKNKIRFILDVQDLWPEAFKMVFNIPILSDLIFLPMQRRANYIYKQADEIVAVSETYANRAMKVNNKCKKATVVYLGTEKDTFDIYAQSSIDKEDEIIISYIGSMSNSYDLFSIIDAISCLKINKNIKLLAMGDGFLKEKFIEYAKEKNIKAEFTGMLPYPKMLQRLVLSDIAVNPIRKGSAGSIINKVGDYAMAGLPVINTQECEEYRNLVDKYEMGFNCENGNIEEIMEKILYLLKNKQLRKKMGLNARKCGEEKFDRKKTYKEIYDVIMERI